jgi:hypothetical protein
MLRGDDSQPQLQASTDASARDPVTTTTVGATEAEVTSRLREILKTRDEALLARNAALLTQVYTADCKCLKDGRELIKQLREENIVWKGVETSITIKSADEVNDRLWIVVATVRTPSVRIENEAGQLIRIVPPEQNVVRFALARPQNEEEWLLGHASNLR